MSVGSTLDASAAISVRESLGSVVTGVLDSSVPAGSGTTGRRSVAGGGVLGAPGGSESSSCFTRRPRSSSAVL